MNFEDVDPSWKEWATVRQKEYIDAVIKYKSIPDAAEGLGIHKSVIYRGLERAEANAIENGHSPKHDLTHPTPKGYNIKGTSNLYNKDGDLILQWVKTQKDKAEQYEALFEAMEVFKEDAKGLSVFVPEPKPITGFDDNKLTIYTMGDPHLGLYSWIEETGENFDLEIAEKYLFFAVNRLVSSSSATEHALIVNLGDFFHGDNLENRTLRSGNALDIDTRWPLVLKTGIKIMIACINKALEKHKYVTVINAIGNHDDHTSIMLSLVLDANFNNNPRVDIKANEKKFQYYEFGKCFIGITHGDTIKPEKLGPLMATDKHKIWGRTLYRYWYIGHTHTKNIIEVPGCIIESFNTLAARDAWTSAHGYRSQRNMHCIVMDKEFGEVERHTIGIDEIKKYVE